MLLISILFYGSRGKYLSLYSQYKVLQLQRSSTGNRKFIATITEDMLTHLSNFQPVNV